MRLLLTWADWNTSAWVVGIDEVESGLTLVDISGGSDALELLWIGQRLVWARGCNKHIRVSLFRLGIGRCALRQLDVQYHLYADDIQLWVIFHPTKIDDAIRPN